MESKNGFRKFQNETDEPNATERLHRPDRSDKVAHVNLTWENFNVYVRPEQKKWCRGGDDVKQKQILRDVAGMAKPGTLLAIIGASGAGKSTLMNALTGRNVAQYIIEGDIRVNGIEVGRGIKTISAYCQQDELFIGTLTVREHLVFRALLRMDMDLSEKSRLERVEDVIVEMGLSKCSETQIGTPGGKKGITGDEIRRLSFASETLCCKFEDSGTYRQMKIDIRNATLAQQKVNSVTDEFRTNQDRYQTAWWKQFSILFWRSWICVVRNTKMFWIQVGQVTVIGLLFGLIYLRQTYDQEGVMNINGAIFMVINYMSYAPLIAVLNSFPVEITIFNKEYGSGLYRVDVYFLAKTFAELPLFIFLPCVFTTIVYWIIGLYDDVFTFLVLVFSLVIILVVNVAVSFGYLISTMSPSVDVALAITQSLVVNFMYFGGLYVNNGSVPVYLLWLKYISWYYYATEAVTVKQWQNVKTVECNIHDHGSFPLRNGSKTTMECYQNGDDVLDYLSFNKDNVVLNICLLCVLMVTFRFLSFLVLLMKARNSKS